jgi:hypothetical protein
VSLGGVVEHAAPGSPGADSTAGARATGGGPGGAPGDTADLAGGVSAVASGVVR